MKSYLITIITVSICVGIYNIIAPEFNGIEKYSKMIGMLVVLCVIISPIKNLMNTFDEEWLQNIKDSIVDSDYTEKGEYDEIFRDYLSSFSLEVKICLCIFLKSKSGFAVVISVEICYNEIT